MKIRKLQLKNIGVFDDEEIEFKECPAKDKAEIHILTGENGTGKTTILYSLASIFNKYFFRDFEPSDDYPTGFVWRNDINSFSKRFRNIGENPPYPSSLLVVNYSHLQNNDGLETVVFAVDESKNITPYDINGDLSTYRTFINNYKGERINFAAFAYSGYRRIKDEPIEIGKEIEGNPLAQTLDFVKDENTKFTVNQWLGQNLLNSSLAQTKKKLDEAEQFHKKVQALEKVINDIIQKETKENEIRFEMQSATKLVLIKNEQELDFDVLPDGLKSLISWIGDLLMRLDSLKWENDTPIFDREIILFLDEIEVHLHPAWQRKVLPIVQKLFKNAQIFVSTHSPFVVNSVDDAWVYELEVKDGKAKVREVTQSNTAFSIQTVLRDVFGIDEKFGEGTQQKLIGFLDKSRNIQQNNGKSEINKDEFLNLAVDLAEKSAEFQSIVFVELAKITQKTGEPYEI